MDAKVNFITGIVVFGLTCYMLGLYQPGIPSWMYLALVVSLAVSLKLIWRNR